MYSKELFLWKIGYLQIMDYTYRLLKVVTNFPDDRPKLNVNVILDGIL